MSPDERRLESGLSCAAWGYFLLHFDVNLGPVSILPAFAGYLLLLSAIGKLSGIRRDLALLRPLGGLLAAWNIFDWLCSWRRMSARGLFPPLALLVAAARLYFHFQFLTDMAALAERFQLQGTGLDRRLRRRRTVYTALTTAIDLVMALPAGLLGEWWEWTAVGMALAALAEALLIMGGLFKLRRCFQEKAKDLTQE